MMKTFRFTESVDGQSEPKIITVPENELTAQQRELLFGDIVHRFNSLPADIKQRFTVELIFKLNKENEKQNEEA